MTRDRIRYQRPMRSLTIHPAEVLPEITGVVVLDWKKHDIHAIALWASEHWRLNLLEYCVRHATDKDDGGDYILDVLIAVPQRYPDGSINEEVDAIPTREKFLVYVHEAGAKNLHTALVYDGPMDY